MKKRIFYTMSFLLVFFLLFENQNISTAEEFSFEKMETSRLESIKNEGNLLFKKGLLQEAKDTLEEGLELARKKKLKTL